MDDCKMLVLFVKEHQKSRKNIQTNPIQSLDLDIENCSSIDTSKTNQQDRQEGENKLLVIPS